MRTLYRSKGELESLPTDVRFIINNLDRAIQHYEQYPDYLIQKNDLKDTLLFNAYSFLSVHQEICQFPPIIECRTILDWKEETTVFDRFNKEKLHDYMSYHSQKEISCPFFEIRIIRGSKKGFELYEFEKFHRKRNLICKWSWYNYKSHVMDYLYLIKTEPLVVPLIHLWS